MTKRILRKTKMVKYCIQKSYEENLKHLKNPQKKESQTSKTVNRSEINTETAELLKPYKNISKQN